MKLTSVLAICAAAALLTSCSADAKAPQESAAPEVTTETTVETTAETNTVLGPVDPAEFETANGGHLLKLESGEICSINGELIDAPFACLLNLKEPLVTEDGTPTMGVEFQKNMFVPSLQLTDPEVIASFEDAGEDAKVLEPGQSLELEDFSVDVETFQEVLFFQNKVQAQFFIAEQEVPMIWFPRPAWLPVPEIYQDVEGIEELLNP